MTREEAIKIVKSATDYTPKEMEALETLIPELRESEDERALRIIKKRMCYDPVPISDEDRRFVENWLEKQKEQKPADNTASSDCMNDGWDNEYMLNTILSNYHLHAEVLKKQNDTEGYKLEKSMENWLRKVVKPLICKEQKLAELNGNETSIAVKNPEAYKIGFADGEAYAKEQGVPAEWSEEDKENSDMICEIIDHCITIPYIGGTLHLSEERKEELKTFIKSLRPSWKPSEEQMNELAHAINLDVYDAKRYGLEILCIMT